MGDWMGLVTQKQTWQIHAVCVSGSKLQLAVCRKMCIRGHANVPGALGGLYVVTASETGTLHYVLVTADGHHLLGTIECGEGRSGSTGEDLGSYSGHKHKAGARERGRRLVLTGAWHRAAQGGFFPYLSLSSLLTEESRLSTSLSLSWAAADALRSNSPGFSQGGGVGNDGGVRCSRFQGS